MEQYILNSLKTEGSKLPVPQLRFPDADKADGHNFTLSSGLNKRNTRDVDAENNDPSTKHAYGFTQLSTSFDWLIINNVQQSWKSCNLSRDRP